MPTPPNEDEYNAFIAHVCNGETVRESCKRVGRSWALIARWIAWSDDHAARYAQARVASATLWADKAVEAAENATALSAPAERIRADVYKWRAKVADPKHYGDRVDVTSGDQRMVSGVIMLPMEVAPEVPAIAQRVDAQRVARDATASAWLASTAGAATTRRLTERTHARDAHARDGGEGVVPDEAPGSTSLGPSANISASSEVAARGCDAETVDAVVEDAETGYGDDLTGYAGA